jgi:uncharacterized protein
MVAPATDSRELSPRERAISDEARSLAQRLHEGAGGAHDFSHVERVLALARRLGREAGADPFVLEIAALLHDVGRAEAGERSAEADRHEEASARTARAFLEARGVSASAVEAIAHAILAHRHRRGSGPETIEAECLYDADKLDSLGAVGTARAYLWLGEHGRSVRYAPESWAGVPDSDNSVEVDSFQREWAIKLSSLPGRMRTPMGRKLAIERADRMREILRWIESEVGGES